MGLQQCLFADWAWAADNRLFYRESQGPSNQGFCIRDYYISFLGFVRVVQGGVLDFALLCKDRQTLPVGITQQTKLPMCAYSAQQGLF